MTKYHEKDDSTLVQMTLLGNSEAFEELVTRHKRAVHSTAYSVCKSKFSAEDASQDAFVSAWMNLSALRDRDKFDVWVCSIAKNHAKTLQAHYRSTIPSISLNEFEGFDIPDESISDIFEYDDLHEKVNALSEKIREAITLHYFCDMPIKEIAAKLSVSEGTVKWRLSEGRKQLRKGYGIVEKTYNENESMVIRVMRQVEALKLWRIKEDKTGFEAEYNAVLKLVNALPDSKEKSHALADTLLLGAWWIPGQKNDEVFRQIKSAAEEGHNEDVMQAVADYEVDKCSTRDKACDFMLNTQIPYFKEKGFQLALGYTWFWLGFEYRRKREFEKAIEAFKETMKIMPRDNEYYANAKSAIYCETKVLETYKKDARTKIYVNTTGEKYRFIDGKLYFWAQPGYGGCEDLNSPEIFWNLSVCNSLMYDPEMKVGDSIVSESGKGVLTFISDGETCVTPAGEFENCLVYEFKGDAYRLTYCKTYISKGVGIVRQETVCDGMSCVLELAKATILGGDGVIPFFEGNRWDYVADNNTDVLYDREIFFEVTAFENNTATVATYIIQKTLGYLDTFMGKFKELRQTYADDFGEKLFDVTPTLNRAKELAKTKREKVRIKVMEDVMERILSTDPEINPNYTEKGRWNFYSEGAITNTNGKVKWVQTEHFEWKDCVNLSTEGRKMLYSFFDSIIDDCELGRWNDEWVPNFTAKPKKPLDEFRVLQNETVTTPAGEFKNCRHIRFKLDLNYYFGGKSECWYANGIGIVKFVHEINENTFAVWQLTDYKGLGDGYYPIKDGLYRKYEPVDIGDGYSASLEYVFDSDESGTYIFRNAKGNQNRADFEKAKK